MVATLQGLCLSEPQMNASGHTERGNSWGLAQQLCKYVAAFTVQMNGEGFVWLDCC